MCLSSSGKLRSVRDLNDRTDQVISGQEYPINPIDLTRVGYTADNETVCFTAFQPMEQAVLAQQGVDFILGDSFLRNAYALFNFGNWTNSSSEQMPYIQLLSVSMTLPMHYGRILTRLCLQTTNQGDAWTQFDDQNNARIAQWNALGGQFNLTNSSQTTPPATKRSVRKRAPYSLPTGISLNEEIIRTYGYWSERL